MGTQVISAPHPLQKMVCSMLDIRDLQWTETEFSLLLGALAFRGKNPDFV
jgi:hypothetical protein